MKKVYHALICAYSYEASLVWNNKALRSIKKIHSVSLQEKSFCAYVSKNICGPKLHKCRIFDT